MQWGIWPNIQMALDWIDNFGDRDRDGFVEYGRVSSDGLVQQGWKDSCDSVFHADGRPAAGPIALCEVQTYVYSAKRGIRAVATALGHDEQSRMLEREAEQLRRRFHEAFWCEEISTLYPKACAPQAWAAGAVFLMLQSCLGLSIRAAQSTIYFAYPQLPESVQSLTIRNLCVGDNSVDFELVRDSHSVSVNVLRRTGSVNVCIKGGSKDIFGI